jgi:sec-independent protein translocase protein TatA
VYAKGEVVVIFGELLGMDFVVVVVVIAIVVFGGSQIPKLARNLGSAKTEFEKGLKSVKVSDDGTDKTSKIQDSDSGK